MIDIKRGETESNKIYYDRVKFITSNIESGYQYNELIKLSKIYINIKYKNNRYDSKIHKTVETLCKLVV